MEDESKKVACSSSSSNAPLAVTIPDVTMEAAAVEMTAAAKEWSPSPSPTAAASSSSEEEEEDDDDTLPQDDLAFARAVASMGENFENAGLDEGEISECEQSTEDEVDSIVAQSPSVAAATATRASAAEDDIDDAGLLRGMLQDSEAYLDSVARADAEEEKQCWVCFATEEDDPTAVWVHPCKCRGTTKWVHQACIERWVDEKQKGHIAADVQCPQCGTTLVIKFPKPNFVVAVLDTVDRFIQKLCPVVAGAFCVGSLYWTGVTFGAVTVMQAVGHDEGLVLMERSDPLFLLVALPLVPVVLVMGKMVRWEEPVLKFLRRTVPRIPLSRHILPVFAHVPDRHKIASSLPPLTDPISVTRTFCGALFFPTVATFLGSSLYPDVQSKLRRTLLGGLTFLTVKGVIKIYHKQHVFVRQGQRKIMDYNEMPSSSSAGVASTQTNQNGPRRQ